MCDGRGSGMARVPGLIAAILPQGSTGDAVKAAIETPWAQRHNPDWGLSMILHAAIGAAIVFPVGVLVGYLWRDRISRSRRDRYLAERRKRKSVALRPKDVF